jgi:hypothetical protein
MELGYPASPSLGSFACWPRRLRCPKTATENWARRPEGLNGGPGLDRVDHANELLAGRAAHELGVEVVANSHA